MLKNGFTVEGVEEAGCPLADPAMALIHASTSSMEMDLERISVNAVAWRKE
jgi:hypothetical protein|tara:strand:+ start:975 stop:1127 length:153 start_codon:yes stop_codon:yes gene_type:complete